MAKKATASKQWARDEEKERYWRETVGAWKSSGTSVRSFCAKNQIPESSFNAWRREINMRDRESGFSGLGGSNMPAVAKVRDARGRLIPNRFRDQRTIATIAQEGPVSPFVPLQIIRTDAPESTPPMPSEMCVEIAMTSGLKLRLSGTTDVAFLTSLIRNLEK